MVEKGSERGWGRERWLKKEVKEVWWEAKGVEKGSENSWDAVTGVGKGI